MWAVGGADAQRLREERLARAGAAQARALAIGLPWPQPTQSVGKPCTKRLWHNLLYASIIAGDEMPDDVVLEPPVWWKRGCGLSPLAAPEASEADHVDADPEPGHVEAGGVDISSRRDIFQTARAHILPNDPEEAASVVLAAGEAHAAISLFRSSKAGVVPEIAPVAEDEPELGGLLVDEGEQAPESELPAPVLEDRNLSLLERCIALG